MKEFLLDSFISISELYMYALFYKSFFKTKWNKICHPILLPIVYAFLCTCINFIFNNIFGWFLSLPLAIITLMLIFRLKFDQALLPYLLSYLFACILEAVILLTLPTSSTSITDDFIRLTGTVVSLIFSFFISLLPLNGLYNIIQKSNMFVKLLIYYVILSFIMLVGLSKIDSQNALQLLPVIAIFAIILLTAGIMIIKQQHTIEMQEQDLQNYTTYEPMADELVKDIRSRQHDFNNQINAISMLPYTHTDYESLAAALTDYSHKLANDYNESELLRINLPVVAGFLFSKVKESERQDKSIKIEIKNMMIETKMPEYDLIKVFGILIDNALEAVNKNTEISLIIDSSNGHIVITTLNPGDFITPELRKKMFTKGYSTKSYSNENIKRGYGLSNLLTLADAYDGKIFAENADINGINYIKFEVII